MGLMDFFIKRRPQQPQGPETPLEELLQRSTTNAAYEKDFFDCLRTADVLFMSDGNKQTGHDASGNPGYTCRMYEDGRIPLFTSPNRITDGRVMRGRINYVGMPALDLFRGTPGSTFILNPFSRFSRELPPEDIQKIVDDTAELEQAPQHAYPKKTDRMTLSVPNPYPHVLADTLRALFTSESGVHKAYIAHVTLADRKKPSSLMVAVSLDGDLMELLAKRRFIPGGLLPSDEKLEFAMLDETWEQAFAEGFEPFYLRW